MIFDPDTMFGPPSADDLDRAVMLMAGVDPRHFVTWRDHLWRQHDDGCWEQISDLSEMDDFVLRELGVKPVGLD